MAKSSSSVPIITMVSAIIFSVVYLAAAWWLVDVFVIRTPPEGSNWERAWQIFVGVQSVGFTAIGILLGTSVQQVRVADAKAETTKAKQAIQDVLKPSATERGGGRALPPEITETLQRGL